MLAADPAMERAEVAISIHEDYKNRGLGWTLLDHVARAAAAKGIKFLEFIELRLTMSRRLRSRRKWASPPLPIPATPPSSSSRRNWADCRKLPIAVSSVQTC